MIRKRSITVPIDERSEQQLRNDVATSMQLIEYYIQEDEFLLLLNNGYFAEINLIDEALIDYFEEEVITDNLKKEKIVIFLENQLKKENEFQIVKIIPVLIFLLNESTKRGTGIYFFF